MYLIGQLEQPRKEERINPDKIVGYPEKVVTNLTDMNPVLVSNINGEIIKFGWVVTLRAKPLANQQTKRYLKVSEKERNGDLNLMKPNRPQECGGHKHILEYFLSHGVFHTYASMFASLRITQPGVLHGEQPKRTLIKDNEKISCATKTEYGEDNDDDVVEKNSQAVPYIK
uniref:Uncharacterized protein n=1 Tax=Glossina palpalis gambiensis TaxID=67801 RepID=A0A1B0B803_9MUSC